jgi:hypothetical protein
MNERTISLALALVLVAGLALAQCTSNTVITFNTGQNSANGTMVDVVNVSASPITVRSFDQSWFVGYNTTISIYTKIGTWSGFEATPAVWTLLGTTPSVAVPAQAFTPIPLALIDVCIKNATMDLHEGGPDATAWLCEGA